MSTEDELRKEIEEVHHAIYEQAYKDGQSKSPYTPINRHQVNAILALLIRDAPKNPTDDLRSELGIVEILNDFGIYSAKHGTGYFEHQDKFIEAKQSIMHLITLARLEGGIEEVFAVLPALKITGDVNAESTLTVEELWSYLVKRKKDLTAAKAALGGKGNE